MASNHRSRPGIVNSWIKKFHNRGMFKQMPVVRMHKKPLPMTCPKENQQKALAKSQTVGKR